MYVRFRVEDFGKLGVPFWGVDLISSNICWGLYWDLQALARYDFEALG